MRRLLFLTILVVNCNILFSQPLQLQLAIQSGLSVPLFDFASSDLSDGSFALPGYTGSLEFRGIYKERWVGFIQAGMQLNPIDVALLGYEKVQADPFLLDVFIRSDPFKVFHLMAGPGYQHRIGKKLLIEGQLSAGMSLSYTPYQLYKPEYFMVGPAYFEIKSSSDLSFAYSAGVRLAYEVTPCYHIGISSQLMNSTGEFQFYTDDGTRTDVRNISLWNTSISVILKLSSPER